MDATTHWRFTRVYDNGEVDSDKLAMALRRYDSLEADERAMAQQAMARSGPDAIRLMRTDVCNSPCDGVIESVEDFADSRSGLNQDASNKLLRAFEDSDWAPDGVPGDEPGTVMEDLEFLDQKNVDQLDESVSDISGTQSGYTGLAGETRTGRRVVRTTTMQILL